MIKNKNMLKYTSKWFTLIEILVWILIFSIVMLGWFYALNSINIGKIKLLQDVSATKDAYYFTEKLFNEIKKWWGIDYEEYFNRKVVWLETQSGHYLKNSWYWNFWHNWSIWSSMYWDSFYYCLSSTTFMWTWWCYGNDFNTLWTNTLGKTQRFWQYSYQFIDYNSNQNIDSWDEDWDWKIEWDDDDENLWIWPIVFSWWENVREIYLINKDNTKRTFFRWKVVDDPYHPDYDDVTKSNWHCDYSDSWSPTWSWCLWTIEVLKLEWVDFWTNHDMSSTWVSDWVIDTWLIDKNFTWLPSYLTAWSDLKSYWQPLFPDNINIKDYEVYVYPNIDSKLNWKDKWISSVNSYIRIKLRLTPSWKEIPLIKWKIPNIDISTTINLFDYFD